jgi:hypothetical protein
MAIIPGFVITIVTFPGYIMHTVAGRLWCDILRVPVYEAHYFTGIIIHEKVEQPWKAALIAYAPFSINSILCSVLFFPVAFSTMLDNEMSGIASTVHGFLVWVGLSVGMHAIPTTEHIKFYMDDIPDYKRKGIGYFIIRSIGVLFSGVNLLKFFWIDFFYAWFIGIIVPYIITKVYMLL